MTITINPKNKKELKKIKTILRAIEVDFQEEAEYSQEFIDDIREAEEEIKNGKYITLKSVEEIDKFLQKL